MIQIEDIIAKAKGVDPLIVGAVSFLFVLVGAYYAGRASVDVSPETICAPVAEGLKKANRQIGTLEGVVLQQRMECATSCTDREQLICMEKLATQLERIKELRCKVCKGEAP